jgi:hypothetical protein
VPLQTNCNKQWRLSLVEDRVVDDNIAGLTTDQSYRGDQSFNTPTSNVPLTGLEHIGFGGLLPRMQRIIRTTSSYFRQDDPVFDLLVDMPAILCGHFYVVALQTMCPHQSQQAESHQGLIEKSHGVEGGVLRTGLEVYLLLQGCG